MRVLGLGQLFVREMGIQVVDGWDRFLFHPLTLELRRKYRRWVNLPIPASIHTLGIFNLADQSKRTAEYGHPPALRPNCPAAPAR